MSGVILFADDHIHIAGRPENRLFDALNKDFPVLGVHSLDLAKESLNSIGTFNAIILDWQFTNEVEDSFADISAELGEDKITISITSAKEDATLKFLEENTFYSLIYIYSETDVENKYPSLKEKFGDKIKFRIKGDNENIANEKESIIKDIKEWAELNKNLSVPLTWSHAINQSVQSIFAELAKADINWILNLYETASSDGVNPEIEVINLLQNLLSEKIITNISLSNAIKELVTSSKGITPVLEDGASIAKLFQRIYYTDLTNFTLDEVPVMTGDVFLLDNELKIYGIIVSPECDIQDICISDSYFEFLIFKESDFNLKNFVGLFGPKNAKIQMDNASIIRTLRSILKKNFRKFNVAAKPPDLFRRGKIKTFEVSEAGEINIKSEKGYVSIEEDFLVKLFISQFEILVNKNIGPGLRVKINEQANEQNLLLLNELLIQAYNQTEKRIHLLPCFKFDTEFPNKTAVIDFRTGKGFKKYSELREQNLQRICKLNNPFIPELRQRYLAYYGRVGVPKIPNVLREYNLSSFRSNF